MKNIISIVLFSILILGCSSNVEDSQALSVKETPDFKDSKGIEMLETFYKEYFALVENSIDPSEIENFRVENCTKEFMKKIKKWKIDYDPFINAQDASAESVNSLIINRVSDRERPARGRLHGRALQGGSGGGAIGATVDLYRS